MPMTILQLEKVVGGAVCQVFEWATGFILRLKL
jgi:hypothetical protein